MPQAKPLSKEDILRAMRFTKSNRAAARYLGCSYQHYKPFAKLHKDEETGLTLFETHLNQCGKGIPKFLPNRRKEPNVKNIIETGTGWESFTPEKIIIALERANIRTALVGTEFDIDLSKYDETFYEVIDNLMLMQFGKQAAEVIFFYVYERMNPDGSINELRDTNDTPIVLNSPSDLWDLINVIKNASSKTTK